MAHRRLPFFRRRLFTALSVLSLLLCIATLALWVRSYRISDVLGWWGNPFYASTETGRLLFIFLDDERAGNLPHHLDTEPQRLLHFWQVPPRERSLRTPPMFEFAGFASTRGAQNWTEFAVPMWFLALLFAILPALYLRSTIRSRRLRRLGHCPRCGYDLRATPDRCPECGNTTTEHTEGTEF